MNGFVQTTLEQLRFTEPLHAIAPPTRKSPIRTKDGAYAVDLVIGQWYDIQDLIALWGCKPQLAFNRRNNIVRLGLAEREIRPYKTTGRVYIRRTE